MMTAPHVLILGGTGEARRLAERLVAHGGVKVTLSLAGRTAAPSPQKAETRTGGFGGAAGLAAYLEAQGVDILLDATHPFAARIAANAAAAARRTDIPLVVLERAEWRPVAGDRWIEAADVAEAARLLDDTPRTVFLAIGRQELASFCAHPHHAYIVRSVDAVASDDRLPGARYILDRGPFAEKSERELFTSHGVEIVVAKNSGGDATYAKIAAARTLGLPVVMVRRPRARPHDAVATVEEAMKKVLHGAGVPAQRGE